VLLSWWFISSSACISIKLSLGASATVNANIYFHNITSGFTIYMYSPHRESKKNNAKNFFGIRSSIIERLSTFISPACSPGNLQVIVKDSTISQTHPYLTWWNINVRKLSRPLRFVVLLKDELARVLMYGRQQLQFYIKSINHASFNNLYYFWCYL